MAGMRASSRSAAPNERAATLLRACLDLVEQLVRQSSEVKPGEIEATLAVLGQAYAEMETEVGAANAVSVSLRNAIGKLKAVRIEMDAK